jgi:Transposase IS66 family
MILPWITPLNVVMSHLLRSEQSPLRLGQLLLLVEESLHRHSSLIPTMRWEQEVTSPKLSEEAQLPAGRFAILNSMKLDLPAIPAAERTPLVDALLAIIDAQQQHIGQLEEKVGQLRDEIAILKGQKPRPTIAPSRLETPPPKPPPADTDKRPGSQKRSKKTLFLTPEKKIVPFPNRPAGAQSDGYEEYFVQDLVIHGSATLYLRERIVTAEGEYLLAPLPANVLPGSHFGPELIAYLIYQHRECNVTQPLLREQLLELGIDISVGQIHRLLTENKEAFHQEKEEVRAAGLDGSDYIGVDDTGARHDGHNGYCTAIGNDLFAYFESTDSKSRLNFLRVLRGVSGAYTISEVALSYFAAQKLAQEVIGRLEAGPRQFADEAAWQAHLQHVGITSERHIRIATEGALLGQLLQQGVSPELVILSDGAPQFAILVHALCWVHAERPLARMIPINDKHRDAIEQVREQIWELYQDLKAYQAQPQPTNKTALEARFDALVEQKVDFTASIGGVLKEMREHKAELLRVLERPEVPLHNNGRESDIRGYVKVRKISGGTRSDAGRRCRDTFATLRKTCRKLGLSFWAYLRDRVHGLGVVPRLADLIRKKAQELAAGQGQAATPTAIGGGAAG